MARRIFKFKNYRNLGLDSDKECILLLNNSLEKGKIGNLIELIGANNSGKSNILDGIISFGNKKLQSNDITTLSFRQEDRNPQVSMIIQDNGELINTLDWKGSSYSSTINNAVKDCSLEDLVNKAENLFQYSVTMDIVLMLKYRNFKMR